MGYWLGDTFQQGSGLPVTGLGLRGLSQSGDLDPVLMLRDSNGNLICKEKCVHYREGVCVLMGLRKWKR